MTSKLSGTYNKPHIPRQRAWKSALLAFSPRRPGACLDAIFQRLSWDEKLELEMFWNAPVCLADLFCVGVSSYAEQVVAVHLSTVQVSWWRGGRLWILINGGLLMLFRIKQIQTSASLKLVHFPLHYACNGEQVSGIFHFQDHFKPKCHFHWVLLKSP